MLSFPGWAAFDFVLVANADSQVLALDLNGYHSADRVSSQLNDHYFDQEVSSSLRKQLVGDF